MSTAVTPAPNSSPALNGAVARRKVVVVLPEGVDPKPLESALARHGAEPLYLDESPVSGSFDDILAERLSGATGLLAVLEGLPAVAQVYAIGYARAVGKRVTVLADDPDHTLRDQFPSSVSLIRGTLADAEQLELLIEDVQDPAGWPPKATPRPVGPILPSNVADALQKRASGPLDDRAVLRLVSEALVTLGIEPAVNDPARLVALWLDGSDPWIGNPVLVRAAGDVRSGAELETLVGEFGHTLRARGRDWGVLVTGQLPAHGENVLALRHSRVLAISLADLLARLKQSSFTEIVLDLRRQRVRGRG